MFKRTVLFKKIKMAKLLKEFRKWKEQDVRMYEFYSDFVKPGSLCFDIGANFGNRTKIFLKLGASVVAVEPQTRCLEFLNACFGDENRVVIVPKALGKETGHLEMFISNESTLSSFSSQWVDAVVASGRFADCSWGEKEMIETTTLDSLIHQFGKPDFVKIDVEGYEYEVISGLSQPLPCISLEFTPEFIDSAIRSLHHLGELGQISCNYSFDESMRLALPEWVNRNEMQSILESLRGDASLFGDIYVRSR